MRTNVLPITNHTVLETLCRVVGVPEERLYGDEEPDHLPLLSPSPLKHRAFRQKLFKSCMGALTSFEFFRFRIFENLNPEAEGGGGHEVHIST